MITKSQAHEVVSKIHYRDWAFEPASQRWSDRLIDPENERVYVQVTYRAPDSTNPGRSFDNQFTFSFSLPETEAEVARAVFETITVIEDHERREFFQVDQDVIIDRQSDHDWLPVRSRSKALFHPHGFNRTAMFHALDPFAAEVRKDLKAYGRPFTADAV